METQDAKQDVRHEEVLNLKIFLAISEFVNDISQESNFAKIKNIQLFNKLLEGTTIRDTKAIGRYIQAFRDFFNNNKEYLTLKKFGSNTKIEYSERIYIDVEWVIKKLTAQESEVIYKHLLTIYGLMNTGKESKNAVELLKKTGNTTVAVSDNSLFKNLENLETPDTPEGQFIRESLSGIADQFSNINTKDANPMQMVSQLMTSGFFQEFTQNLQDKFASGEININSLISTAGSMVGSDSGVDISQLTQMMGAMGAMNSLGGESISPTDLLKSLENPKKSVESVDSVD